MEQVYKRNDFIVKLFACLFIAIFFIFSFIGTKVFASCDFSYNDVTYQLPDEFEDYNYREHYGENYYQPVAGATQKAANAQIFEGYLEASNMQVVSEMVNMITVNRAYESNQKVIQTIDTTLDKAVNQLGTV